MPQAVPGFDSAETFSNRLVGSFFRRMIPTMVMSAAIAWLVLGLILGLLMTPLGHAGLRWLLVLVLGLAFGASLYRMERKQLTATWSGSTLQLSPFGAVAFDRYVRIELPWSGLRKIERGSLIDPFTIVGERPAEIAGAVAAVSAHRNEERLIGEGSLSLSPDAPARVRRQIRQDYQPGCQRAIVLTHYDPDWRSGRIGQWVHAYRPDLMT